MPRTATRSRRPSQPQPAPSKSPKALLPHGKRQPHPAPCRRAPAAAMRRALAGVAAATVHAAPAARAVRTASNRTRDAQGAPATRAAPIRALGRARGTQARRRRRCRVLRSAGASRQRVAARCPRARGAPRVSPAARRPARARARSGPSARNRRVATYAIATQSVEDASPPRSRLRPDSCGVRALGVQGRNDQLACSDRRGVENRTQGSPRVAIRVAPRTSFAPLRFVDACSAGPSISPVMCRPAISRKTRAARALAPPRACQV
jgi:hypothetical protein